MERRGEESDRNEEEKPKRRKGKGEGEIDEEREANEEVMEGRGGFKRAKHSRGQRR